MPMNPFTGQVVNIPGIYPGMEVVRSGILNLQPHSIPVIMGTAKSGIPCNSNRVYFDGTLTPIPAPVRAIERYYDLASVQRTFGSKSDVSVAFDYFKRNGGRTAYIANVTQNKQTIFYIGADAPTSPPPVIYEALLKCTTNQYGAHTGDGQLEISVDDDGSVPSGWSASLTFIPSAGCTYLSNTLSGVLPGSNSIEVWDTSGLYVGQQIFFTDNDPLTIPASCTITAIVTPSTYYSTGTITISGTIWDGSVEEDARIFWQGGAKIGSGLTTLNEIKEWLMANADMGVEFFSDSIEDSFRPLSINDGASPVPAGLSLRLWEDPVDTGIHTQIGVSPSYPRSVVSGGSGTGTQSPTQPWPLSDGLVLTGTSPWLYLSNEFDKIETDDGYRPNMIAFANDYYKNQNYNPEVSGVDASYQPNLYNAMLFATSEESLDVPQEMLVFAGNEWGTFQPSTDPTTHPEGDLYRRAAQLNSQNVVLCAPGADNLGSAFSVAPQAMAVLSSTFADINLTNKKIQTYGLEYTYNKAVQDGLIAHGILGVISKRSGKVLLKGINTLQNNTASGGWNIDGTTWLITQFHLFRYFRRELIFNLDPLIGARGIVKIKVFAAVKAICDSFVAAGLIESYSIGNITRHPSNEGWIIDGVAISLSKELNYIFPKIEVLV